MSFNQQNHLNPETETFIVNKPFSNVISKKQLISQSLKCIWPEKKLL